jgi:hypothetical protein
MPGRDLRALTQVDRDALFARLGNRQLVPGGSGTLKVDAVIETAARLVNEHLNSADEIRSAARKDSWGVRRIMQATNGVGPATSNYFLMLLGVEGVKADTMVIGFVERSLGRPSSQTKIEQLMVAAAEALRCTPIRLDHAIWRHESDRRRNAPRER